MLQLPPTEKDDRLNLNVRTGLASVLHNSLVFTFAGLTIGLDLDPVTPAEISLTFLLKLGNNKSKKLSKYLSSELFYLDLISKYWTRVILPPLAPRPKPRMYHELAKGTNSIYVFGGLCLPDDADDNDLQTLVPCNDLWEFNLTTKSWILLHDGANWESDHSIPKPRYCHKMTVINRLPFTKKKDHFGLMIAGGQDYKSNSLYDNVVFDLVDKTYVDSGNPVVFSVTTGNTEKDNSTGLSCFDATNDKALLNVNYLNSIIVNFTEEVEYHHHHHSHNSETLQPIEQNKSVVEEESIIIYSPTTPSAIEALNPLLSFRIGKKFGKGRVLTLHKKRLNKPLPGNAKVDGVMHRTIPHNLRYPTGGTFGQNLVITGFLPNDFDISIFIYNKPTGKWSRLNIFCHHDYGSHRFWGGFAWTSHHKVVLLGNYVTSRTTSSVRYFSSMITVSLPVTNVLASFEMAGDHLHNFQGKYFTFNEGASNDDTHSSSSCEDESSSSILQLSDIDDDDLPDSHPIRKFSNISTRSEGKNGQHTISFSEYVHYAAPKVNFTKIRSVFPPAAITLGRNAFDRYGDLISDFELVSTNGDRIPVCMSILMERWGRYFIDLLAKAYVKAIDKFETDEGSAESRSKLRSSKSSGTGSVGSKSMKMSSTGSEGSHAEALKDKSFHVSIPVVKPSQKEAPQFRLPFQDTGSTGSLNSREGSIGPTTSVDPHKIATERQNSTSSFSSAASLLTSHLQDIPPQLPLPSEPIPAVPATPISFRSSSRKNSTDPTSPRSSLIHTLTVLRSIPSGTNKSPRSSPFTSPRNSVPDVQEHRTLDIPASAYRQTQSRRVSNTLSESADSAGERGSDSDDKKYILHPDANRSTSSASIGLSSAKKSSLSTLISDPYDADPNSPKSSFCESHDGKDGEIFNHALLNFENIDASTFKMEPSLIPRKLYIPFGTNTLKAFAEYLYTGQVGNKWTLRPCALDCMLMARYLQVPLLYDLISEVLFGIIGRKEAHVIKEGNDLKKKYIELFERSNLPLTSTFRFPLDEYEGFMDTVDDGYLDIALLRKSSNLHKNSVSSTSSRRKASTALKMSISEDEPAAFGQQDYFQSKLLRKTPEEPRSPKSGNANDDQDDSTGKSDEGDEGDDLGQEIHYLDFHERKATFGPRSKSVFDRSIHESIATYAAEDDDDEKENVLLTTLESLVAPDSPAPSDYVIDLIYETSSMCTDVKLMLRSMNVRHMSMALKESREQYDKLYALLHVAEPSLRKTTITEIPQMSARPSVGGSIPTITTRPSLASLIRTGTDALLRSATDLTGLHPMPSSASLLTMTTAKSSQDLSQQAPAFKLTPFKPIKPESRDTKGSLEDNKEVDKRIAQLIKKDEKLKQKAAKEDKVKRHQLKKLEKKKTELEKKDKKATDSDTASIISKATTTNMELTPSAPRHGFLHRFGTKMRQAEVGSDSLGDLSSLSRTKSAASLTSSTSKTSKTGKKPSGLFGGLRKHK